MPTIITLAHHATNRVASISTTLRVVMQGYADGYWETVSHDHKVITPQQVYDAVQVLKTMDWVVVND
jgi:alanine racemase